MLLKQIGEFGLIKKLTHRLKKKSDLLVGVGDDCAVVRTGRYGPAVLLTTDMLIEGQHFCLDWMTPEEIGRKAVRVNLSDIAAMGGVPRYVLVAVGLPQRWKVREAERLFSGIKKEIEATGALLVGGDTNAAPQLILSIAVIGNISGKRFLTRRGAKVGDNLYVTGALGDSALGLAVLKKGKPKRDKFKEFVQRHFLPPLRITVGQRLAANPAVHSLIDLSDGLAGDLQHILEEGGVGAEVWLDRLPRSPGFTEAARRLNLDPLPLQLGGGEDYELLFSAGSGFKAKKIVGVPVTKIGTILPHSAGLVLKDSKGKRTNHFQGFRHF